MQAVLDNLQSPMFLRDEKRSKIQKYIKLQSRGHPEFFNKIYILAFFQALHITDVLHKSVTDLKIKIEENATSRVLTDRQLTRMIVELDDVSLSCFECSRI